MISTLEKIQRSIAGCLCRMEALRGVKVILDSSSSLSGIIEEKLFQKLGLSLLVKMPIPTVAAVNGSAISFTTIVATIRIMEIVPLNQTGLTCSAAAEQVLKSLNGFVPEGANAAMTPRSDYPWNLLTGTTIAKLTGTTTTSVTTKLPGTTTAVSMMTNANAIEVVFTTGANL
jgi:hypothetical protein